MVILDGTMSSLDDGYETNTGRTHKLLCEADPDMSLYYAARVQWRGLRSAPDVMMGRGINRQIRRAYGFLASRYRPGDHIFLLGYSRGAFAVRSLAGVIDRVGLLTAAHSEERHIRTIYRIYESGEGRADHEHFVAEHCHKSAPIEMVIRSKRWAMVYLCSGGGVRLNMRFTTTIWVAPSSTGFTQSRAMKHATVTPLFCGLAPKIGKAASTTTFANAYIIPSTRVSSAIRQR